MAATKQEIKDWLSQARERGATHMIVMCDTYDWEDYPVFVMPGEDPRKRQKHPGSMQKVMECYSMALSDDEQLAAFRAQNWD